MHFYAAYFSLNFLSMHIRVQAMLDGFQLPRLVLIVIPILVEASGAPVAPWAPVYYIINNIPQGRGLGS